MDIRDPDDFHIEFVSAGDPPREMVARVMSSRNQTCPVKFSISRAEQGFEVEVFVSKTDVLPEDYVRVAKHQLHLDFARLAQQTAGWRLPEPEQDPA